MRRYTLLVFWFTVLLMLLSACGRPSINTSNGEECAWIGNECLSGLTDFEEQEDGLAPEQGSVEVLSQISFAPQSLGVTPETLNLQGLETQSLAMPLGESGTIRVAQANKDEWHWLNFANSYRNPVVIMNPLSFRSGHSAMIRIKEVTSDGVRFQIDEWDYLSTPAKGNGSHPAEDVSYIVWEQSSLQLGDLRIEAGLLDVNQAWQQVNLKLNHPAAPVVLSQVQSYNNASAVTTRQRFKSRNAFEVRLQEEERADGTHTNEKVAYFAVSRGNYSWGNLIIRTGSTARKVTQNWYSQSFSASGADNSTPILIAGIQSYFGAEPVVLRYRNLTRTGVQFRAQEEQSADRESRHPAEDVGYIILQESASLNAKGDYWADPPVEEWDLCQSGRLGFNLSSLHGIDEDSLSYEFNFGDGSGSLASGEDNVEHLYSRVGTYSASVKVYGNRQLLWSQENIQVIVQDRGDCTGSITGGSNGKRPYIVLLKEGLGTASVDIASASLSSMGLEPMHTYRKTIQGFALNMTPEQATQIGALAEVAGIFPDMKVELFASQSPTPSWGIGRIDQRDLPLDSRYNYDSTGAGVHVYVIDTGIRSSHNDFGGRVSGGVSFVDDGIGTEDCNGHGTHVAATTGGSSHGVAKEVFLHAVRVFGCSGGANYSTVIAAVEWVTANHAKRLWSTCL
ncbi:MAG: S8 family serine peptidase [Deinococcales bacterium]